MPAYEYECVDCSKDFTVVMSLRELEASPKVVCPHCGSDNIRRKITGFFARTGRKS